MRVTFRGRNSWRIFAGYLLPEPIYLSLFEPGPGQDLLCWLNKMCILLSLKLFFKLHSANLSVKTCMKQRNIFAPWGANCLLYKGPGTVVYIFLYCWDPILFWDVLKEPLKKELHVTPYTIRKDALRNPNSIPYDMVIILGLYSLWRSCITVLHVDFTPTPVHIFLVQCIPHINTILKF